MTFQVKKIIVEYIMEITILCKVVDNFGDIGFVYRLARNISELYPSVGLRLVVSDLASFTAMAPEVNPCEPFQTVNGWRIFDWNNKELCFAEFSGHLPLLILECFQCGRPDWLEEILFSGEQKQIVRIVNIEYLTAESWADDFHLLKSGTRSALVKKVNFMPGFTARTGGLVLDNDFLQNLAPSLKNESQFCEQGNALQTKPPACEESEASKTAAFCVTIFSYPRSFLHVVNALKKFQTLKQQTEPSFKVLVFAANGLSQKPFEKAWEESGRPFSLTKLPYLRQQEWDALLCKSDFNFVRGEDSFARACLCGRPFVWHAYEQDEGVHFEKVRAVLERIKPFVKDEALYALLREYFLLYNTRPVCDTCANSEPPGNADASFATEAATLEQKEETLLLELLLHYDELKDSMESFSKDLLTHGNLTVHLMEYLEDVLDGGVKAAPISF